MIGDGDSRCKSGYD